TIRVTAAGCPKASTPAADRCLPRPQGAPDLSEEALEPFWRRAVHTVEREIGRRPWRAERDPGPAHGKTPRWITHDHGTQPVAAIGRDVGDLFDVRHGRNELALVRLVPAADEDETHARQENA